MRTWLLVTAAALAACGAPPGAARGDAAPDTSSSERTAQARAVQPAQATFRDWTVSCDNGGDCVAFAGPVEGYGGWLRVAMAAGPAATPTVHAGLWGDGGSESASPLKLAVDGRDVELSPDPDLGEDGVGQVSDSAASTLVRALGNARSVVLTKGARTLALSPNGAAAALLWIDERQGRLDTVTALRRTGRKPAAEVPAAPTLPVVAAAPRTDQTGLPAEGVDATLPTAFAALSAVKECRANLDWNPDIFTAVSRDRLDADTELWGVPCDAGAYNLMMRYWITGPDGVDPRAIALQGTEGEPEYVLTNPEYDPATRTLRQFAKARGIGDCGVFQTWTWTGRGFVLSEERVMGECWGVPFDLWPTHWRSRER